MLDNIQLQHSFAILRQAEKELEIIFGQPVLLNINKPIQKLLARKDIRADTFLIIKALGTTLDLLISHSRKEDIVASRQVACYVLRIKYRHTFDKIGEVFNRDHTTIIHSVETVKDLIEANDKLILEKLEHVKQLLEPHETETNQSRDAQPNQPRKSSITVIPSPNLYRAPYQNNDYQVMGRAPAANHHTPASLSH